MYSRYVLQPTSSPCLLEEFFSSFGTESGTSSPSPNNTASAASIMVPVSKWHSDGSDPCTSSVAKAIANRSQSQPFGWDWTLTKSKCSVSALGLIMEHTACFTGKEILDGVPLS